MRVSIFGFGDFGQLVAKYLVPRTEVLVFDRNQKKTELIKSFGAQPVDLQTAAQADVIILAFNLEVMESMLQEIVPHLRPGSLVVDVMSVKVKPVEIMQRLVPEHSDILATHPLFGPVSAGDTLAGHKIVIDPIRVRNLTEIEQFLTSLGLEIVHMRANEHDREMAWVHALTFFVGRGLLEIKPPKSDLSTHYYNELLDVVNVEKTHSWELFLTIQRGNPYADEMRRKFTAALADLEQKIQQ